MANNRRKVWNKDFRGFELSKIETCPRCKGRGEVPIDTENDGCCYLCEGKGRLRLAVSGWTRVLDSNNDKESTYY